MTFEDFDKHLKEEPVAPEIPPPFDWETCVSMLNKFDGQERAIALGISMVSEQLNYICTKLAEQ